MLDWNRGPKASRSNTLYSEPPLIPTEHPLYYLFNNVHLGFHPDSLIDKVLEGEI
jgi:hypothetical protein